MVLKIQNHSFFYTKNLVKVHEKGPSAGSNFKKTLDLDFSKIKNEQINIKNKKGVSKKVSPEDMWQLIGLSPACHTYNT